MANPRNDASIAQLTELIGDAQTFFLVDYQGLSAGELNSLRSKMYETGGRLLVAKNTLINLVLKKQGVDSFDDALKGPTAIVLVGEDDPVSPVKALNEFAKEQKNDLPIPKGGMLQGSQIDVSAFERIAKLPSRDQLLSQFIGVLEAPMQQLVGVLNGPQQKLVGVLNNYSEKLKEEE